MSASKLKHTIAFPSALGELTLSELSREELKGLLDTKPQNFTRLGPKDQLFQIIKDSLVIQKREGGISQNLKNSLNSLLSHEEIRSVVSNEVLKELTEVIQPQLETSDISDTESESEAELEKPEEPEVVDLSPESPGSSSLAMSDEDEDTSIDKMLDSPDEDETPLPRPRTPPYSPVKTEAEKNHPMKKKTMQDCPFLPPATVKSNNKKEGNFFLSSIVKNVNILFYSRSILLHSQRGGQQQPDSWIAIA